MNLKKTVLSLMAAGSILLGGVGTVSAQSATGVSSGTVYVYTVGSFDAQFCNASFSFTNVTLTSAHPTGTAGASVAICYTDTQANRGVFRTYMKADSFTDGGGNYIAATNVSPAWMYNVIQGQWGLGSHGIGDIGAMTGNANYNDGGYVNGGPGLAWSGGNLSGWQYVGYAWAGHGTGGSMYKEPPYPNTDNTLLNNGSIAPIDLTLTVASTTVQGIYTAVFTLQVNPTAP